MYRKLKLLHFYVDILSEKNYDFNIRFYEEILMVSIARMALKPGMELAEDVISLSNGVILPANTVLDEMKIAKLARYSIMCVSIKDAEDYAVTHFEKVRVTKTFARFEEVYNNNLNAYKYMINSFLETGAPVNTAYLLQIHDNIYGCAKNGEQLLDMLYNMLPSEDDMTYAHCLNSALISTVFGIWLGLSREDIRILTLCGFFYDIGKLKLPNSLLWKPDKLNDFEFNWMKTHTTIGYDLIKNQRLDQHILNATLMHHERNDGSGYPKHLKDDDIDLFAKYTAIVDSYEAMTSARTYRASLTPFQVIHNFEKTGFEKYGYSIIYRILEHIANTQLGFTVRLNNDVTGDVILINKNLLSKPLIKCGDQVLDLSKEPELEIVAVL